MEVSRRNALASSNMKLDWKPSHFTVIRGTSEGFCVNHKDEAHATETEQKVENSWNSGDIEFLVQGCPEDSTLP